MSESIEVRHVCYENNQSWLNWLKSVVCWKKSTEYTLGYTWIYNFVFSDAQQDPSRRARGIISDFPRSYLCKNFYSVV